MPAISVAMPARNAADTLSRAIISLQRQTDGDWELVLVDDASDDGTAAVAEQFADKRIRIVRNESQQGVGGSLNRALAAADSDYIARLDADDFSLPHRFEIQRAHLDAHPEIGVLGTRVRARGVSYKSRAVQYGLQHATTVLAPAAVSWGLLISNQVSHPTVMMRRDVLDDDHPYPDDVAFEDYLLWLRLRERTSIENLPCATVDHFVSENSAGLHNRRVKEAEIAAHLASIGRDVTGLPMTAEAATALLGPRAEHTAQARELAIAYVEAVLHQAKQALSASDYDEVAAAASLRSQLLGDRNAVRLAGPTARTALRHARDTARHRVRHPVA
jgi:glycosyltransferase involved in cell wall biosynthesis